MDNRRRSNLVTFLAQAVPAPGPGNTSAPETRVYLTLDGPWKYGAGLKPDVNTATVPFTEFDKLAGVADRTGNIEFWYTKNPGDGIADVVLEGWRIVEVEATDAGIPFIPIGGSGRNQARIVEYRLHFADFRDQFTFPRGGRLRIGLVNAGPAPIDPNSTGPVDGGDGAPDDGQGNPPAKITPEMTLSELISQCLTAMGAADWPLPAGIDDVAAPRDLQWFGNHAPSELQKLLEVAGCAFCPLPNATGRVCKITSQGDPQINAPDELLPTFQIPAIDRRGKTIIFSSYPYPITETLDLEGPRDDQWYFVIQDSTGKWVKPADADILQVGSDPSTPGSPQGLLDHWKQSFAGIDAKYRQRVASQAYRCIQLGDGSGSPPTGADGFPAPTRAMPPVGLAPILLRRIEDAGDEAQLQVKAKAAYKDAYWAYHKPTDFRYIEATFRFEGNVITVNEPLLTVSTDGTLDFRNDAQELQSGDFHVRFTIDQYEQRSDGKWYPKFFHAGYTKQLGKVVRLTDQEVQNLLDSPGGSGGAGGADVMVLSHQDLRLRVVNDSPRNLQNLQDVTLARATQWLADSGQPTRIVGAVGFAQVLIDGLVSEVQWDQQKVRTLASLNAWFRPAGALDVTMGRRLETEGEAYPNQAMAQEQRIALGRSGADTRTGPLQPTPSSPPDGSVAVILQVGSAIGAGEYNATVMTGTSKDAGGDLSMPDGLMVGSSVLLVNMEEDGDKSGTNQLARGSYAIGKVQGRSKESNPRPIAFCRGGFGSQSPVTTVDPAGNNADNTTWERSGNQGGADPTNLITGAMLIYVVTRNVYDASTKNFYMFQREMSYDARGLLFRLGPEERIAVFTASGACS